MNRIVITKRKPKTSFNNGLRVRHKEARCPVTPKGSSLLVLLKSIALSASLALLAARMLVSCIRIN